MSSSRRFTFYCILIYIIVFIMYGSQVFALSKQNVLFDLGQSQYITETTVDSQSNHYTQLLLRYDFHKELNHWQFKADALTQFLMDDQDGVYVAAPEFYAQYELKSYKKLIFGRYKHDWSQLENYWRLDMWQPQLKWDFLRPESQGIFGFYYKGKLRPWNVTLMYSPLFLPEQGPLFKVEDGKISSRSRWFKPPMSQVEIQYGVSNVYYDFLMPEYSDILNHSGYGVQFTNGHWDHGLHLSLSYAYKPMNQFHLGINTQRIQKLPTGQLNPVLLPVVVKHHLSAAEATYSWTDLKVTASVMSEIPEQPELPESWEQTDLNSNYFAGLIVSTRMDWDRQSEFKLGFIKHDVLTRLNGKSSIVKGDLAAPTQRFVFDKAVSFTWMRNWLNGKLSTDMEYLYSVEDDGGLLSVEMDYKPQQKLSWYVKMDVLGANKTDQGNTFLNNYKSNDRFEGGFKYVF